MSIFGFLIPADVHAVVASLDSEPEAWVPHYIDSKLYHLTHRSGLKLCCANGSAGMNVREFAGGRVLFGGVTMLSVIDLSFGHVALHNAVRRWVRWRSQVAPAPKLPTAAEILSGAQS